MNLSPIEWLQGGLTWNPVTGCPRPKVSPGCANCYAERVMNTRLRHLYGEERPFERIHFHPERLDQPRKVKKPSRIFVGSMCDLFHDDIEVETLERVFWEFSKCPQHTFLLLTKRPEKMRWWFTDGINFGALHPNVWLGVTVCNPDELHKLDIIRETPAAKRYVSFEPLLGDPGPVNLTGIDWVICGAETGPGARPMNYAWAYKLAEQCWSAGTPFFFKSWGEWTPAFYQPDGGYKVNADANIPHGYEAEYHIFPENPGIRMYRVGKRRSGRSLDERGPIWSEVPS